MIIIEDPYMFCQIYPNSLRNAYMVKYMVILIKYCLSTIVNLVKVTAHING